VSSYCGFANQPPVKPTSVSITPGTWRRMSSALQEQPLASRRFRRPLGLDLIAHPGFSSDNVAAVAGLVAAASPSAMRSTDPGGIENANVTPGPSFATAQRRPR